MVPSVKSCQKLFDLKQLFIILLLFGYSYNNTTPLSLSPRALNRKEINDKEYRAKEMQ